MHRGALFEFFPLNIVRFPDYLFVVLAKFPDQLPYAVFMRSTNF
jgi:hypothetical protein